MGADVIDDAFVAVRCAIGLVGLDADREESGLELRALASED